VSIPEKLESRLMVVSREDYIRVRDDHPARVQGSHVTIVPIPLLGKWLEFSELRNSELLSGQAYIVDQGNPSRYVPAQKAVRQAALTKSDLLLKVCQALGATSLEATESSTESRTDTVKNRFTADADQSAGHAGGKDPATIASGQQISVDLVGELKKQLIVQIQTRGRWEGAPASIEDARKAIEGYSDDTVNDLRMLIDQRESLTNPVHELNREVEFLSELYRDFELLVQAATHFEAGLGPISLNEGLKISNAFELHNSQIRQMRLKICVRFAGATP
jgi:hypothetical protein